MAYGEHLADLTCRTCHGADLEGGLQAVRAYRIDSVDGGVIRFRMETNRLSAHIDRLSAIDCYSRPGAGS